MNDVFKSAITAMADKLPFSLGGRLMTDEQIKEIMRFTLEEANRATGGDLLHHDKKLNTEQDRYLDLWLAGYKAAHPIKQPITTGVTTL